MSIVTKRLSPATRHNNFLIKHAANTILNIPIAYVDFETVLLAIEILRL